VPDLRQPGRPHLFPGDRIARAARQEHLGELHRRHLGSSRAYHDVEQIGWLAGAPSPPELDCTYDLALHTEPEHRTTQTGVTFPGSCEDCARDDLVQHPAQPGRAFRRHERVSKMPIDEPVAGVGPLAVRHQGPLYRLLELPGVCSDVSAKQRPGCASHLLLRRARTERASPCMKEVGVILVQPLAVGQDGPGRSRLTYTELTSREPQGLGVRERLIEKQQRISMKLYGRRSFFHSYVPRKSHPHPSTKPSGRSPHRPLRLNK
jgi:hypothetical protein